MMKNGGRMECVQIHPPLRTKQQHKLNKNHNGKQKAAKESKSPGEDGLPQSWLPPLPVVVVTAVRRGGV